MLIYLREALILVSGWGFFRGFGGSVFVRVGVFFFFFLLLFLAEPLQCGSPLGMGWPDSRERVHSPAVFPLSPSCEQNLAEIPFFPEQILSSAALF